MSSQIHATRQIKRILKSDLCEGLGGGAGFRCGRRNDEKREGGLRWPLGSLKPIAGGKS